LDTPFEFYDNVSLVILRQNYTKFCERIFTAEPNFNGILVAPLGSKKLVDSLNRFIDVSSCGSHKDFSVMLGPLSFPVRNNDMALSLLSDRTRKTKRLT
jgi:hypothetical protein